MYLILDDGTNVCGTVDELVDFLNKYKTQHIVYTNRIPEGSTGDDSYLKGLKFIHSTSNDSYLKALECIIATGVCPSEI